MAKQDDVREYCKRGDHQKLVEGEVFGLYLGERAFSVSRLGLESAEKKKTS